MNSISWLIFWADVAPALSTFFCITFFLGFVVSLVLTAVYLLGGEETREYWKQLQNYETKEMKELRINRYTDSARICQKLAFARWLAPLFFLGWGCSFLVPSKEAFYMIAGSQVGEQAIKTPEFVKVRAVINTWLDKAAKPATPAK